MRSRESGPNPASLTSGPRRRMMASDVTTAAPAAVSVCVFVLVGAQFVLVGAQLGVCENSNRQPPTLGLRLAFTLGRHVVLDRVDGHVCEADGCSTGGFHTLGRRRRRRIDDHILAWRPSDFFLDRRQSSNNSVGGTGRIRCQVQL